MRADEISPKKLVVFDIDDTLVYTQTKVHVVKDGRVVNSLNSHDFTHYKLQPGEEFDFGDFRNAKDFFNNSKPNIPMMNQLKRDINTGNKVVMVTARADFDDKELFLDTFRKFGVDMSKVHVYRAGNSKEGTTEERKKTIIKKLLDQDNYTKAIMYDDAKPNLHTFMELKKDHPSTRFYAWHVSLDGNASEYMREAVKENFADREIVEKVAWQNSLSKKLFDFEGNEFSSIEERFLLPINSSVLKRLGEDEVRATVFHVTSYDNLDVMIKNQNTQKALSTFFHMNPEKFTSGVATSGGLVFELDANVLLASNEDIESQVDESGRRWIPMEFMARNTGEFNTSDLIDEVPELLSQLVKKYTNKNTDDPYMAWKKLGQSLNQKGDGKTLNLLIKDFFDGIYKIYLKHKDELIKFLRGHLSDRTPMDDTNDWDEMISNNYKIKTIHVINTPELKKNPDILSNIKSTGIPYDIWNTGSKLSSHVKKTVDREKAEYVAKQEKDNSKQTPRSNFVIKSPAGFMWDEFRIFNLNKNGKLDLGSAISKLSPEEQEWAKLRWGQGLRLGDIGKKYGLNNSKSLEKYKLIHDKIRQHLGIKESIFSNLQSVEENFADGKVKGKSRPGRFKQAGVSCKGSVTSLRKKAKNSSGEKQKGYHWCANMKSGKKK